MSLHQFALFSIALGLLCFLIMTVIVIRRPQPMKIMNLVWPLTMLYAGPLGLWMYFLTGREKSGHSMPMQVKMPAMPAMKEMPGMEGMQGMKGMSEQEPGHDHMKMGKKKPSWQSVVKGTLHCGSGCTLGDLMAEWLLAGFPVVLLGSRLAGTWTVDFIFAFCIGILFQYFALRPMSKMSGPDVLKAALKADFLSLTFWQIGMYGWMAISFFVIFHRMLNAADPVFWLMMQIAMIAGFLMALPVNAWLIKKGIKEAM